MLLLIFLLFQFYSLVDVELDVDNVTEFGGWSEGIAVGGW